jgi:dihydropteroate synthase
MDAAGRARRDRFLSAARQRPVIMAILNVTPDSFSDGGRFAAPAAAIARAEAMVAEGCDIVDIGGESTRPEAEPVGAPDEFARVAPVVAELAPRLPAAISIDTYKADVAAQALSLGAVVVNDVWGLQKDPAMAAVAAAAEAAVIITHNRPAKDEALDILADIRRFFDRSLALAAAAGIPREHLILDPGVGFAKTSRQNLAALAGIAALTDYGLPILVGVSRKRFLGSLLAVDDRHLLAATIAANLAAAAHGASVFRVHDVAEHVAALKVFQLLRAGAAPT